MPSASQHHRASTLLAVSLGMFVLALDTQVNVALPELTRAFAAPIARLQWVIIAYVLTGTALMAAFGRLADLAGRARLWVGGLVLLALGLTIDGLAPRFELLLVGRMVQACGMAMVSATGPALVSAVYPPERRGRALGLMAAGGSLGAAAGPLSGGVLVDAFGWRAAFLSRAPLALAVALISLTLVRGIARGPATGGRFDGVGAALLALTTAQVLLALNRGPVWGWTSSAVLAMLLTWPALLWLFLWWERRQLAPVLNPALFLDLRVAVAGATALLSSLASFGVWLLMPYLLVNGRGLSAAASGWYLALVPLATAVTAPLGGRAADRAGPRRPVLLGLLLEAVALAIIAAGSERAPAASLVAALLLLGAGLGLFTAPNQSIVMGAVPPSAFGVAAGMLSMMRSLGVVSGVAVLGAVYTSTQKGGPSRSAFDGDAFRLAFSVAAATAAAALAVHLLAARRRREAVAPARSES